ncbi:hypothetical protein AMECASPLE_000776 [Ameca splendens]|uniref:Secreted protein n=1 Tax=Ameca splendens TaxID=208324 RepID=A0ABV0X9R8_9TELE
MSAAEYAFIIFFANVRVLFAWTTWFCWSTEYSLRCGSDKFISITISMEAQQLIYSLVFLSFCCSHINHLLVRMILSSSTFYDSCLTVQSASFSSWPPDCGELSFHTDRCR